MIGAVRGFFFALVVMICVSACTTSKQAPQVSITSSAQSLIDTLAAQQKTYSFFECKARLKFNGEESKIGGRMHVRMIQDSLVWLNFKKLTVEGARALARKDSTWILYRMDDVYEGGPTENLLSNLKIFRSFEELQDLMVGNVYIPQANLTRYSSDQGHHLSFDRDGDRYVYTFDADHHLSKIWIKDVFGREVMIHLTDYDSEKQMFIRREILITDVDGGLSRISMKLSSITFDQPKSIPFEIPDHYTRL